MEAIIITKEELHTLQKDVAEIKSMLQRKPEEAIKASWIESKRVPELLGISPKTWQNWRDKRVIPFSQYGAKIYVKLDEINKHLEKHMIKP
ncbi:MAG: helix-turn-helix domain-containing protein [Bacteroidia bacterium]